MADELWSHTQKGKRALQKEEYEKAYDHFSDAVASEPTNQEAQYNKALALTYLQRGDEAETILSGLSFEDSTKESDKFYTQALIAEAQGDGAAQQKDYGNARKAYQNSLQKYAQSMITDPQNSDARNNIEILGYKIGQLPPEQEQDKKDQQDQNDDKNKEDKKDQNKEEKKDDKNEDQNDQENKDKDKKDEEKSDEEQEKQDQEEKKDSSDNQQEEPQEEDKQEKPEEKQPQQSPEEQAQEEQERQNALQQIMQYADDAKELNKPPKKKVVPVANGKEW